MGWDVQKDVTALHENVSLPPIISQGWSQVQLPAREPRPRALASSREVKEVGFKDTQHCLSHGHTED